MSATEIDGEDLSAKIFGGWLVLVFCWLWIPAFIGVWVFRKAWRLVE